MSALTQRPQSASWISTSKYPLLNVCQRPALSVFLLALSLLLPACAPPAAKAPEREYMFWPPAPDAPHIQFLMSISSSADVTAAQGKLDSILYGKERANDLPFSRPYGIRMYNGCIYVCDATSNNVSILDLRKHEVRILGRTGTVTLAKPIDIAVASDGIKYVADTGHGAVLVFDATDKYAGRISVPHLRPVSVAVHENELFVADHTASKVRVFDRFDGKELRTIGEPGGGPGKLGGAMGIAVDNQGNLYVNDLVGCRVQKFGPDGKVLYTIGGIGDRPGSFVRPKHMAVDSTNILYVVDNAFQNVQMFNDKGQILMFFGASGGHPGSMSMPAGICTSDTDLDIFQPFVNPAFELQRVILVTNNLGLSKINIYGLGVLKPGKTLADLTGRVNRTVGFQEAPKSDLPPLPAGDVDPATQPATQSATPPATEPAAAPATKPAPNGQKPF